MFKLPGEAHGSRRICDIEFPASTSPNRWRCEVHPKLEKNEAASLLKTGMHESHLPENEAASSLRTNPVTKNHRNFGRSG
jgi:hypothetical protein